MPVKIYHTSPEKITEIHENGLFGDVFFWALKPYCIGGCEQIYKLELDDSEIIDVSQLYDDEIIKKISKKANVDLETAEKFLNGSLNEWDYFDDEFRYNNPDFDLADFSWQLQKFRGYVARKMGFIACKDVDEQGDVYIIKMNNVFERAKIHEKFY